jgi:hypothetical protein
MPDLHEIEERIQAQAERANMALGELRDATDDNARLEAAKALESAACQLRRALKKKIG